MSVNPRNLICTESVVQQTFPHEESDDDEDDDDDDDNNNNNNNNISTLF